MTNLTLKQLRVLEWVNRFSKERGYQPSLREMCDAFHFKSPNGAMAHILALKRKGYVDSVEGQQRTLHLIRPLAEVLAEHPEISIEVKP